MAASKVAPHVTVRDGIRSGICGQSFPS